MLVHGVEASGHVRRCKVKWDIWKVRTAFSGEDPPTFMHLYDGRGAQHVLIRGY